MPDKTSLFQAISKKVRGLQGKPAPVVLLTLNSRFSHTGLAVRTLEAYLRQRWPDSYTNLASDSHKDLASDSHKDLASDSHKNLPSDSHKDLASDSHKDLPSDSHASLASDSYTVPPSDRHTNLPEIVRIESTIHEPPLRVLRRLFQTNAGVFAFSCYIWNINQIRALTRDLRKICPEALIIWGGPEAGSDPDQVIRSHPEVDFIIRGEGEAAFLDLLKSLYSREADTFSLAIPGLSWRHPLTGAVSHEPERPRLKGEDWVFPYSGRDLEQDKNKMLYYETSRGCPFRCTYCLSSIDKHLRFKPLDRVFSEIDLFLSHQVRQVKCVDRTFNADINRAKKIWAHLISRQQEQQTDQKTSESWKQRREQTNFHFEIAGDLLDEASVSLLATAPPGLIQLEIGVQTTQSHVLQAICRPCDLPLLRKRVAALLKAGNIHLHLDLIAGLPGETLDQFASSFNDVFNMGAHQLQLGFLKVLPGTPIASSAKALGFAWQQGAPYEILRSDQLRFDQLCLLKDISQLLESYWNHGLIRPVVRYLIKRAASPFAFFASFARWLGQHDGFDRSLSPSDQCCQLWQFAVQHNADLRAETAKGQAFLDSIRFFYLESGQKDQPVWMGFWEQLTRDNQNTRSGLSEAYIQSLLKKVKKNRRQFQQTYTHIKRWRVDHFTFSVDRFRSDGELVLADETVFFDLSGPRPKRLHVPE